MKAIALAAVVLALAVGSVAPGWAQGFGGAGGPEAALAGANEVVIKGKVDAVTVYRGQALVTRVIDLPAGAGLGEVVVSELPERIVPGSIFAEAGGAGGAAPAEGVEVRSVRYRERPVGQDVREEVRKLDAEFITLNDKMAAVTKQQQLLNEQRAYLDKLSNFAAPTATVEMTKGVLNADQLKNLTTFQFDQRKSIGEQELKLAQEQRAISEQLSVVQRKRSDVTGKSSRTLREAVVFVSRKGGGSVRVRYLVDAAGWSPSYNIRADAERKSATVEYQASIQQMSGEDWNDVQMTLSTATPNLIAAAPNLTPLTINLVQRSAGDPVTEMAKKLDYNEGKKQFSQMQQQAEVTRANVGNGANWNVQAVNKPGSGWVNPTLNNLDNDKDLNRVAEQLQVLELLAADGKDGDGRRAMATEGIVVTYAMRARTSLPSRADQQLVQIDTLPMKSEFYKVAVPVLTTYVYDEATLTNTSKVVMLAGPVASYVGGQFVGNGVVPTVAVGQPFTVGFGIDSSLRATRERLEKTETMQGGNRVVNYAYRLAVDNYGTVPANVRLMDRLPTGKDGEVRVTFVDVPAPDGAALSKDKEYLLAERKKGILRWDVTVPPQKNGSEAFSLTYKMNMEYDRNLAISAGGVLKGQDLEKIMSH
jgi:hypothetical protein